jgi:hypothetical protein
MREVGLYALIFGVNKTVRKFGYDERLVKELVIKAFDDPFVKVIREIVLETVKQVGKKQTCNIFKIAPSTLQRFIDQHSSELACIKEYELVVDEWMICKD